MRVEYTGNIEDVTKAIRHIMIDKDIKQKDICNVTGWSKSTVSNLLNNRTDNPSMAVLLTLCEALDCKLYIDIE